VRGDVKCEMLNVKFGEVWRTLPPPAGAQVFFDMGNHGLTPEASHWRPLRGLRAGGQGDGREGG
jgi:hypothetical protein